MTEDSPPEIKALENVYGTARSDGFGSAVFYETLPNGMTIDEAALKHYRDFVGAERFAENEAAWLNGRQNVYVRKQGNRSDILTELNGIDDDAAKLSVPLLTELIADTEEGKKALSAAFDDPRITELTVNLIGDEAALSGIMITAVSDENKVCSVVCLMD